MAKSVTFSIDISPRAKEALQAFANDRGLWAGVIVSAYQQSVDKMFRTGGFGHWAPLSAFTIERRRSGSGKHYRRRQASGVSALGPPNTWTGTLRDTIAGRKLASFTPRSLSQGRQNIKIRTRLSYASHVLSARPIEGAVLNELIKMIEVRIVEGLRQDIDRLT